MRSLNVKEAENLKTLLAAYDAAVAKSDAADDAWAEDLENEELEAAWADAYEAQWHAFKALAQGIVSASLTRIDERTARNIIKAKLPELRALIEQAQI